jgi:hypothetical protein
MVKKKQKMVAIPLKELARWVAMSTELYFAVHNLEKFPKRLKASPNLVKLSNHLYMSIMAPLPTEGYAMARRLQKSGAITREIKQLVKQEEHQ